MSGLNYKVKEFMLEDITKENSLIKIPQFQRGLVWSKENQKNFINTMMDGDPFGAILLSQTDEDEYLLVDGLQRVSTIKRFLKKPEDFIDTKFIDDKLFEEFLNIYMNRNLIPEVGRRQYIEKMRNILLDEYNKCASAVQLASALIMIYEPHSQDVPTIYNVIDKIYLNMQNKMKLNSALIPAIIYTGDERNLPNVFERMNKGAVTLSKYEVLASTWFQFEIFVNDAEISRYVKEKYLSIKEQSYLEINFDTDELDNKINVFEYCYAISEILKDKQNGYKPLFGEKKKELSTDSLGFDLIAVLLKNKVNEVSEIKSFIYNAPIDFISNFKNAIKRTAEGITKILLPWVSYKTSSGNQILNVISGYQAIHIFASYFEILYTFDSKGYILVEKNDKVNKEKFKKYLPLHILKDIASNYWGINRQVSDLHLNITDSDLLNKYLHSISIDDLENDLIQFIDKSNQNTRKTISNDSKFLLNYIHKLTLEKNQEYREKFFDKAIDFEHITPKDRVKEFIDNIAISSIANLCVMLPRDNRAKKSYTLYEDEAFKASYELSASILGLMIYPKKLELRFLELPSDQKQIQYVDFLKNRRNTLVNKIKSILSNYYNI